MKELAIPLYICTPFVILLLVIAIFPLAFPHFWEKNRNKVIMTAVISLPVLIYLLSLSPGSLAQTSQDYISFILILASLYIISGGVLIKGDLKASPMVTSTFLLLGAVLGNFIGTTGASMVLIRPLLNTIKERKHVIHIPVFFIFLVSNIGGTLIPLGPPLFLGYLRGVPLTWTLSLFPQWIVTVGLVLTIFYLWDTLAYRKEMKTDIIKDNTQRKPLRIIGTINLLFTLIVIMVVFFQVPFPYRELVMILMAVLSLIFTKKENRLENRFTFNPIIEVAILFAGIFITMVPLLILLETKGAQLGITRPWQYFWLSGGLSSFLDNAPTYLTFATLAASVTKSLGVVGVHGIGVKPDLLTAISCGASFMGANTYIGNGPNFMVKSICDEQKIKTPHFFGYMIYSGLVLIPIFLLLTFVFFV